MSTVNSIIQNMSAETREKAEAFARAKGVSLEEAVSSQLSVELSEGALRATSGGLARLAVAAGEENNEEVCAR